MAVADSHAVQFITLSGLPASRSASLLRAAAQVAMAFAAHRELLLLHVLESGIRHINVNIDGHSVFRSTWDHSLE